MRDPELLRAQLPAAGRWHRHGRLYDHVLPRLTLGQAKTELDGRADESGPQRPLSSFGHTTFAYLLRNRERPHSGTWGAPRGIGVANHAARSHVGRTSRSQSVRQSPQATVRMRAERQVSDSGLRRDETRARRSRTSQKEEQKFCSRSITLRVTATARAARRSSRTQTAQSPGNGKGFREDERLYFRAADLYARTPCLSWRILRTLGYGQVKGERDEVREREKVLSGVPSVLSPRFRCRGL